MLSANDKTTYPSPITIPDAANSTIISGIIFSPLTAWFEKRAGNRRPPAPAQ